MFPIRDDNPHCLTPYTTYGIIALNIIAWVLLHGLGTEPMLSGSVCRLGLIPGELLQTVPAGTRFQVGPGSVCVIGYTSGRPVDFRQLRLLKGVGSSPGARRARHLVTDELA